VPLIVKDLPVAYHHHHLFVFFSWAASDNLDGLHLLFFVAMIILVLLYTSEYNSN